jgi:hypothetical protein
MPRIIKELQPKNLAKYDVYVEDTSSTSAYFQITNLPSQFTGGRNSFLLAGSPLLAPGSSIQIEIIDANGISIFQNPVKQYLQGNSRLISVQITEKTAPGFATIIIMGSAKTLADGKEIPPDWENKYNVRWIKRILVSPNIRSSSPIVLENIPTLLVEEQRLYSFATASYNTSVTNFTASLTPTMYSGHQIGYLIKAETPTSFSADYDTSYITGSLIINNLSASLYLPIDDILNSSTAFTTGKLIKTSDNKIINKLYLRSGSYVTNVADVTGSVTSSAKLVYSKLDTVNLRIPISYAKLRVVGLGTVSGEIYKLKVYNKVSSDISDYKLIADVPLTTSELLITSSIRGDLPIGDFNISPTVSANWYADRLETASNVIYPISGSRRYYTPSASPINDFPLSVSDNILLRSIKAEVPIHNNQRYEGYISSSGYFIGNKKGILVFPTTEYTLQLDAFYNKISGSVNLTGPRSTVDIYIIGVDNNKIVSNDPLGQKIGTLEVNADAQSQWFRDTTINFTPNISKAGNVGIRFVINNGLWNFSEISLKPASDKLFSPDEVQFIIPNTEYYNELLQYKVEFFDINNNSTEVVAISTPTFFIGSNIDLGTLSMPTTTTTTTAAPGASTTTTTLAPGASTTTTTLAPGASTTTTTLAPGASTTTTTLAPGASTTTTTLAPGATTTTTTAPLSTFSLTTTSKIYSLSGSVSQSWNDVLWVTSSTLSTWLIGGSKGFATSSNGITWGQAYNIGIRSVVRNIVWVDHLSILAAAVTTTDEANQRIEIFTSSNASDWASVARIPTKSGEDSRVHTLTYANDINSLVLVQSSNINDELTFYTSSDAKTWTYVHSQSFGGISGSKSFVGNGLRRNSSSQYWIAPSYTSSIELALEGPPYIAFTTIFYTSSNLVTWGTFSQDSIGRYLPGWRYINAVMTDEDIFFASNQAISKDEDKNSTYIKNLNLIASVGYRAGGTVYSSSIFSSSLAIGDEGGPPYPGAPFSAGPTQSFWTTTGKFSNSSGYPWVRQVDLPTITYNLYLPYYPGYIPPQTSQAQWEKVASTPTNDVLVVQANTFYGTQSYDTGLGTHSVAIINYNGI